MNIRRIAAMILSLLVLLTTAVPAFAQNTKPRADQVYDDGMVMFNYPADWVACDDCDPEGLTMVVGNTENAVYALPDEMQPDDVQVLIMKDAVQYLPELTGMSYPDANIFEALEAYFGVPEAEQTFVVVDERGTTYMHLSNEAENSDLIIALVEMGEGQVGGIIAAGMYGSVTAVEDEVAAIAASMRLSGMDYSGEIEVITGQDVVSPAVEGNSEALTFADPDVALTFEYPEAWLFEESEGIIYGASSTEALYVPELTDLQVGEMLMAIFPTTAALPDYDFPIDENTGPSTIISFYASMGFATGYIQVGAMEELTREDDDREAWSTLAVSEELGLERLYIAIEDGQGDITVMLAYAQQGSMEALRPALEDLAFSFISQ